LAAANVSPLTETFPAFPAEEENVLAVEPYPAGFLANSEPVALRAHARRVDATQVLSMFPHAPQVKSSPTGVVHAEQLIWPSPAYRPASMFRIRVRDPTVERGLLYRTLYCTGACSDIK
jgi:hypothetical protein